MHANLKAAFVGVIGGLVLGLAQPAAAQNHKMDPSPAPKSSPKGPTALQAAPKDLPSWMSRRTQDEVFYRRGTYNFDVFSNIDPLARDLNAVAVGHSMAYEDMVTGKAATLDTKTFDRINRVLNNPPKNMPAERFLSPTFGRYYGYLEKLFDWTHILHAQTIDVLASTQLTDEQKDREIRELWRYYKETVPYTVSGLPLNMEYLDSQAYSGAFRRKYPKVNGLFWGYHWLQGIVYDMLWRTPLDQQRKQYEVFGKRYHETELYRTDRDFMPMFAELSPNFSRRFPDMANAFDNLHMLHDMVNDILVTDWMTDLQKEQQIKRAIWTVVDDPHKGEKPGDFNEKDAMHDHRFMEGQPGMGMMKMATPQLMFMPGMGWMSMSECGHCSMPMEFDGEHPMGATVSAEGWTMNVRCLLCARDMASQVRGQTVVRAETEDPQRQLILISDDEGNWSSNLNEVVFLEVQGPHPRCNSWSRAFTSRSAFDKYIRENEEYAEAKPLSLAEWSQLSGGEPDTYERKEGPVSNPYRPEDKPDEEKSS
jgi:hypothetical protein